MSWERDIFLCEMLKKGGEKTNRIDEIQLLNVWFAEDDLRFTILLFLFHTGKVVRISVVCCTELVCWEQFVLKRLLADEEQPFAFM